MANLGSFLFSNIYLKMVAFLNKFELVMDDSMNDDICANSDLLL
jgi:hypothetical protein